MYSLLRSRSFGLARDLTPFLMRWPILRPFLMSGSPATDASSARTVKRCGIADSPGSDRGKGVSAMRREHHCIRGWKGQ